MDSKENKFLIEFDDSVVEIRVYSELADATGNISIRPSEFGDGYTVTWYPYMSKMRCSNRQEALTVFREYFDRATKLHSGDEEPFAIFTVLRDSWDITEEDGNDIKLKISSEQ